MTTRVLHRAHAGDLGKCCRCGLRRAYFVMIEFDTTNRFGLRDRSHRLRFFCTTHGRVYAAKFKLEVAD
jgi:hypothetical protein